MFLPWLDRGDISKDLLILFSLGFPKLEFGCGVLTIGRFLFLATRGHSKAYPIVALSLLGSGPQYSVSLLLD